MSYFDPLLIGVPLFVVSIMAEALIARRRGMAGYETWDTATSLLLGLGNLVVGALTAGVFYLIFSFLYRYRLFTVPDGALAAGAAFLLHDFCYYWAHRWMHEIRLGWASHRVHHSSQHYNLATALRQTWIDLPTFIGWLPYLPLPLLGFSPAVIVFAGGLGLVYAFFQHTEHIRRLPGWCEYIFATPSHHRVHHAVNARYLDANYGNTFIVWDRLFGTFIGEDDSEPCRFGLVHNVATFNPVRIAIGEPVAILRDLARAPDWRSRFAYVFGPPGYSHDGSRLTSKMMKAQLGRK